MDNKLKKLMVRCRNTGCENAGRRNMGWNIEGKSAEGRKQMKNRRCRSNILVSYIITAAMVLSLFGFGTAPVYGDVGSKYDIEWLTTFGDSRYDEGFSVIAVEDGLVCTGTVSDSDGLQYTFLVKTDGNGNTLWEKRFGGDFHSVGRSVSKTADGGYIIAGINKTTMTSNDKVHLIKTDGEGNRQWEQKLDLNDQGYAYSRRQGFSVKEATDGGYIIAGSIIMGGSGDALVIKTSSLGKVSWALLYGGMEWDCFYDVEVVEDGYIAGGYTEINGKNYEYVVKISNYGEQMWNYVGTSPAAQVKDVKVASDGSVMACGYRGSNISVLKLSGEGVYRWGRAYDGGIGYDLEELAHGDFIIAGSKHVLVVKPTGAKSWAQSLKGKAFGQDVYANSVTLLDSGAMIFAGYVDQANWDACLFRLGAVRASLGVSAANVLPGGSVYLFAPLFLDDGHSDRRATAEVEVKVKKGDEVLETIPLSDGNFYPSDDFEDHDGVYSAWYTVPESVAAADSVDFELFVDGVKEDTRTVNVIDDPELVVLTHFEALYEEFIDTGTSATLDENNNKVPDYFDLMDRVQKYAEKYRGVVLDVNEEISVEKGSLVNYSTLDYDKSRNAYYMADWIDDLMDKVYGDFGANIKNVAIIGDDEVIPFYRKSDPLFKEKIKTNESRYVPSAMKGKDWGNPTLRDTKTGPYIMTDVPYGTYSINKPDNDHLPIPVAGVGRIFADRPFVLTKMIDGYETPINLIPEQSCAAVFSLDKDPVRKIMEAGVEKEIEGVDFPTCVKNAITSVLDPKYGKIVPSEPFYLKGYYYWLEGTLRKWGGSDVIKGIEAADISFIWSHADHMRENAQDYPDLTYNTFRSLMDSPGHMLINAGCHSGYSVSHNNSMSKNESYLPYDHSMVKQIISKQIAYMAPTTYGFSTNNQPTDHDLISKLFLEALLDGTPGTTGDKWRKAYEDYNTYLTTTHTNIFDWFSVYAIYGMGYYGLPTQPVVTSAADLAALNARASERTDAAAVSTPLTAVEASLHSITEDRRMNLSIEIPEPVQRTNEKGEALLEIPGGSDFTRDYFAPRLPVIQKTYIFPAGSNVNSVSLKSSVERAVLGPMQLQKLVPVDKTNGSHEGSFEFDGPYPAERFTWAEKEREDGVYLTIVAAPAQYDPNNEDVSVLSRMDFEIEYTAPVGGTNITEVVVNNGSKVSTGASDIPVGVKIDSDFAGEALLHWQVRDNSGLIIESGTQNLDLVVGGNELDVHFDTEGWTPGDKGLTLLLRQDGVIASWFGDISVSGLYADLVMDKRVYEPSEPDVEFIVEIRDEDGAPVTDLTVENFRVKADGDPVAGLVMEEFPAESGSYQFSFPVANVAENIDIHQLIVSCVNEGKGSAPVYEGFAVREDRSGPEVIRTDPAQNEAGVVTDAAITITFNEELFEGEKFGEMQLIREGEGEDIPVTIEKVIDSDSLIITPAEPLALNSVYKLTIPSKAVADSKGNEFLYAYHLRFITYAEPDLTPPVVESSLPEEGETDFPAKAAVKVDFSESVGAGVNAADILWLADGVPVDFTMTFYANQLILTPKEPVPYRADCRVTIPEGAINDLSGNPLETEYAFTFTIEEAADTQPPLLLWTMPEHEMTGVLTDSLITLQFDEILLEGPNYSEILLAEAGDDMPGEALAYTAELQRDTLTLTPEQSFIMDQEYVVRVPAGAVTDLIGNSPDEAIEIRFTTGELADEKAPLIEETIPGHGAEGVLTDARVYVYFDEAVHEGDAFMNIGLLDRSHGGEGDHVGFTSSILGRTLILTPNVELKHGCEYRVRIPAGSVKDLTGNLSEESMVFDFTTEDAPDTRPPRLTETNPSEGAADVSIYTRIIFTFDELIQAGIEYNNIGISGPDGDIAFTKSINGRQLALTVTGGMPLSTELAVSLPANSISDLLGNQLDEVISLNFTTVAEDIGDVTPPVTTHSVTGVEGTSGWYTSSVKVTLTATDDISGVVSTSWSLDGESWNDYTKPFSVDRQGEVTVYYRSEDVGGNVETVKSFTLKIDTESPVISSSVPANNASGIWLNQAIKVTFNESISGGPTYGNIDLRTESGSLSISKEAAGKVLTITPESMAYNTTYRLVIPAGAVVDDAGNRLKTEYTLNFTTKAEDSGGGDVGGGGVGGGGGSTMPPAEGIDVKGSINDREEPFVGVGETEEGSDLIPITIDCALLNKKLEASGANPRVQISVGNGEGVQFTGLTGQTVKNMEQLGAVLEICTRLAEYTLPADLLDIDGVAEQYGQGVDLQDIRVDIKVASPLPESVRIVEDAGRGGNVSILVPPVEFTIECSCNGRIVEVASFKAPVERTIPIPKGIDPDRVTTGVVVERDGTLRHVPTRIVEIDGIYYAKISSLTNSIYTLIWNQVKFRDMEGHWAKEYVNDLGSRLVVAGTSGDIYSPDRPVTRAELAAIITRALGVKSQTGGSEFTDVSAGDWFLGAVNAAAEYGIVSGYSDRTFRPMQMITREEGFAMIAKALELANLKNRTVIEMTSLQTEKVAEPADLKTGAEMELTRLETGTAMELKETQVIEILGKFTDKESLSSWCEKPAAFVIVNGLVAGYDGKLMPQSRITRAEAATMVEQMLKNAELINR